MENLHTILRCLYFIWVFLHDATLYWERKKFYCYSTSFFSYILHTKHKKANKNVISIPNHTILSLKWVMHPSAAISVMLYVCFNFLQSFSTCTFVISTARCLFVTDYYFYITFYYLKVEFTWKGKFSPTKGYNITLLELYEADDLNDFDDFILFFSVGFLHFKTSPIYFSCLRE